MTLAASPSTPTARLGRPLALLAGAALLAPTLLRPDGHGPVLCPLRRITGVWCPGCGMTRAFGWLAHGDLHQSLRYHPLAPLLVVQGVLLGAFWLYRRRTRHDRPATSVLSAPIMRTVLVANALLVLAVWVIRLKSGSFDDLG
jgi:Protein of unknown function (DUF2752)